MTAKQAKPHKFEPTTVIAKKLLDANTGQVGFVKFEGFKFGNTGLGYYRHPTEDSKIKLYYVMHLASGFSMGMPVSTQKQAKDIVTEAAALEVDWNIADEKPLANAILLDGSRVFDKYREIYNKRIGIA